jgi:hypothetical protein
MVNVTLGINGLAITWCNADCSAIWVNIIVQHTDCDAAWPLRSFGVSKREGVVATNGGA